MSNSASNFDSVYTNSTHISRNTFAWYSPLYLSYNQWGPGHYDGTRPLNQIEPAEVCDLSTAGTVYNMQVDVICSCGVNSKVVLTEVSNSPLMNSCVHNSRKLRYPCLKREMECTNLCRSKNCGNGKNVTTHTTSTASPLYIAWKRTRFSQFNPARAENYLLCLNALVNSGSYTIKERCLVHSVMHIIRRKGL